MSIFFVDFPNLLLNLLLAGVLDLVRRREGKKLFYRLNFIHD